MGTGGSGKGCLVRQLGLERFMHKGVEQGGELGLMIDSSCQKASKWWDSGAGSWGWPQSQSGIPTWEFLGADRRKVSRAEGMDRWKPGRVRTNGSESRLHWLQR